MRMSRLFVFIFACVVAMAPLGPRTGMAVEAETAIETIKAVAVDAGNESLFDSHSQMDCCDQSSHTVTDHYGHCGISCAIVANSMATVHQISETDLISAEPGGLVGSDLESPKRPPRALL